MADLCNSLNFVNTKCSKELVQLQRRPYCVCWYWLHIQKVSQH